MALLRLLLVPVRAPMLLLLLAISIYLGLNWGLAMERSAAALTAVAPLAWLAEGAQALLVVFFCSMPDLLVRRFSMLLAASRVVTLVATLLLVTIAGLYLLHLEVLSNVLILSSAVLLARLDLLRLRLAPPPLVLALILSLLVLVGAGFGLGLSQARHPGHSWFPAAPWQARPTPHRHHSTAELRRIPLFGRVGSQGGRPSRPASHPSGEP